jgi:hypothetical protein
MCINCWQEAGYKTIINDRVKEAARLVEELYLTESGGVGGYGHIVFDDWNLDCVASCLHDAENALYKDNLCEETRLASMAALKAFEALSEDERASALALYEGFIKEDNL